MAYLDDFDLKQLKKGKFGPLDVYPQEEKQKEDELSSDFVKSGFKYLIPELLREHEYQGIAKDQPLLNNNNFDNDVVKLLLQIVNKKEESSINSQIEANKKQHVPPKATQTFRPSLILITGNQKTKEAAYAWFKQLANNESLAKLAKKIPVFNKRADNLPEILITLYEYKVPTTRAVWYLKIMVLAYSANLNDVAKKKRQPNIDVSSEWSLPLIKFLREIFNRLNNLDQPNNNSFNSLESFMNVDNLASILLPVITHNYLNEQKLKCLWNFTSKIMRSMLDQNLLDKQFILESLIDLLEKSISQISKMSNNQTVSQSITLNHFGDLSSTKLITNTILQNMNHFLQSELLSRRLAYFCCKLISIIFNEYSNCFFDSRVSQAQFKQNFVSSSSPSLPLKSSSTNALLSLPTILQQKSPDISNNQLNNNLNTKLKPFVTNISNVNNSNKNLLNNHLGENKLDNQVQSFSSSFIDNNDDSANSIESANHFVKKYVSEDSIKYLFDKIFENSVHKEQIVILTSIVQAIELGSMQSLIWNDVGDGKTESPYNGSPLDFLPCPPSLLLYTYDYFGVEKRTKELIQNELEKAELCIKRRSLAVENKWTTTKLKLASIGIMHTKTLGLLDILDKHCYDLNDVNDTIDTLYSKIFPKVDLHGKKRYDLFKKIINDNKTSDIDLNDEDLSKCPEEQKEINSPLTDREIIYLLCDWATTTKRCGLHRIYYIVFLIKKRQIDIINQFKEANEAIKNKIKQKLSKKRRNKKYKKAISNSSHNFKTDLNIQEDNSKKRKLNFYEDDIDTKQFLDSVSVSNNSNNTMSNAINYLNSAKKIRLDKNSDYSFETSDLKMDITIQNNSKSTTILMNNNNLNEISKKKLLISPKSQLTVLTRKTENLYNKKLKLKAKMVKIKRKNLIKMRIKRLKLKKINERMEFKSYEFLFQNVLFDYLEIRASKVDDASYESRYQFSNLIALYYMFINCKVFSHDLFVKTLISRGETFKNNLNDIKRPFRNINSNITTNNLKQLNQQKQLQFKNISYQQSNSNISVINQQFSVDNSSPISLYQQQPASMPPYNMPPHTPLQVQKSINNIISDSTYINPKSVPTPSKSNCVNGNFEETNTNMCAENLKSQFQQAKYNSKHARSNFVFKQNMNINKAMSKLATFVLHFPIPQSQNYLHERNQRFVVLYGFGSNKHEISEKLNQVTKNLKNLFSRKLSIDLNDTTIKSLSNSNARQSYTSNINLKKHYNTITTSNIALSTAEIEKLNQLSSQYSKLSYYDQYSIVDKINWYLIDIYKTISQKNYLPKLQYIQFIFDIMESNLNIFNLLIFAIRLLQVGPLIERFLKSKFLPQNIVNNNLNNINSNASININNSNSKIIYFEYVSYFYLNIIGVLRLHLLSLVLWKDLASQVFKYLFRLITHIERPSKCSSHEKCALMLLNEMYGACGYLKQIFPQFEQIAHKIKIEKCFTQAPLIDKINTNSMSFQMKSDELLTSMITTTDHTIDEIEQYINSKSLYYNFVAHVFVSISNLSKDEMLRVANLCAELTCRSSILIALWHNATKVLHQRNTEPTRERAMFSELLNKINIQIPRCKENFKLFLSVLASRHCLILNELIIMVVKTCVMACPGITSDQSHNYTLLEPSASLACHIIQYLFTSAPKPLVYRRSTYDQRMITASLRSICFNSFLLVLKCLFLLSEPNNRITNNNSNSRSSNNARNSSSNRNNSSNNIERSSANDESNDTLELDQFSSNVLLEICEHDWIKERCFNEGDNLLKHNQLLEPALGRRAQNLLHIICYPHSHQLRKQNEQSSTKDFIKNILQNLNLWTLRESLLEFKLMFELEKQKDRYYEYFVECLAKTTVDYLIDPEKSLQQTSSSLSTNQYSLVNQKVQRSNSINNHNLVNDDKDDQIDNSVIIADPNSIKSPHTEEKLDLGDNNINSKNNFFNTNQMNIENQFNQFENSDENDINDNFGTIDSVEVHDGLDDFNNLKDNRLSTQPIGIWLIAPLITKLPDACQLKVLDHSSKILQDMGKSFWNAKTKNDKIVQAIKNINAWHQQPFFSLLISCLRSKEEGPRYLLTALFNGLTDFISHGKEDKILSEDPRIKQIMLETLHVRLSLVGSMFDFILRNSNDFANWAWLFVQLIYSGVVDPDVDQLLFTMIVDMLVVLIHHIITLEPNLDVNKHYQTIIKKISKETKDFSDLPNTKAINYIRRLMPLNRNTYLDILTVDSYFTTLSKTFSNLYDKRRGFKFAKKEKINTWELIEGVKNASSLCFSWYGAAKLDRKMLKFEFQQKLLFRHRHINIHKDLNYLKEKYEAQNDLLELNEPLVPILKIPPNNLQLIQINDQKNTPACKLEIKKPSAYSALSSHQIQPPNAIISLASPSNQTSLNTSSEDIVLIGSSAPTSILSQSNSITNNHQNIQNHPQIHSQMLNRLQQQVTQHPSQGHYIDALNTSNDLSKASNSLLTPEKQRVQSNQAKKRTPRRQQSRTSNTNSSNSQSITPNQNLNLNTSQQQILQSQSKGTIIGQSSQMINQMNMQQKIINSQQQQQQPSIAQRSTNSPMLGQVSQSTFQPNTTSIYQNNPNNRPNTNLSNISQGQQNLIVGQTNMNQQSHRVTTANNQSSTANSSNSQVFQTSSQYIQQQPQQNQQSNNRANIVQPGNRNTFPASSMSLNSNSNQLVNQTIQANIPSHANSGLNIQAQQQQRKLQIQNQQIITNTQVSQQQQQKQVYSSSQNIVGQPPIYGSIKQPIQASNNSPMQSVQRTTTPETGMVMQQQHQQLKYPINSAQQRLQQTIQTQSQQQRMQFNSNLNQSSLQNQPSQINQNQMVNQQNLNWQQRQQNPGIQRQQQYQTPNLPNQQFIQKQIPNQSQTSGVTNIIQNQQRHVASQQQPQQQQPPQYPNF